MMRFDAATDAPEHSRWKFDSGIATVMLDRPHLKNPLTFESYVELRDLFRARVYVPAVKALVVSGAGG